MNKHPPAEQAPATTPDPKTRPRLSKGARHLVAVVATAAMVSIGAGLAAPQQAQAGGTEWAFAIAGAKQFLKNMSGDQPMSMQENIVRAGTSAGTIVLAREMGRKLDDGRNRDLVTVLAANESEAIADGVVKWTGVGQAPAPSAGHAPGVMPRETGSMHAPAVMPRDYDARHGQPYQQPTQQVHRETVYGPVGENVTTVDRRFVGNAPPAQSQPAPSAAADKVAMAGTAADGTPVLIICDMATSACVQNAVASAEMASAMEQRINTRANTSTVQM